MIDLRSLRQFVTLAHELHFGRAAERLHMTQPPLTLAIQKLEASLGVLLFERSQRRVALSTAGRALLELAEPLLRQAEAIPAQVQAAASGSRGHLRLGFVSTVGYGDMPQWLRSFRERHPEVTVQLREATLDVQLQAFERQDLDAGFVIHAPGAAPLGFESLRVSRDALVLAHATGQVFGTGARGLQAILSQPLIIFPRDIAPSIHDAVLAFYRDHGVQPHIAQEAIQMQTIVNLVSSGMGVAWVPEALCALQRQGVSYLRLPRLRLPQCETRLVWQDPAPPVVARFAAHIQAQLKMPLR